MMRLLLAKFKEQITKRKSQSRNELKEDAFAVLRLIRLHSVAPSDVQLICISLATAYSTFDRQNSPEAATSFTFSWNIYIHTRIHTAHTYTATCIHHVHTAVAVSLLNVHDDCYTHISTSIYLYHVSVYFYYQWRFVRSKRHWGACRPKGAGKRIEVRLMKQEEGRRI